MMGFDDKCEILAELWLDFRDDEELENFVAYNILGLSLAYLIHTEQVIPTEVCEPHVEETYNMLVKSFGLDLDQDFFTLHQMVSASPNK